MLTGKAPAIYGCTIMKSLSKGYICKPELLDFGSEECLTLEEAEAKGFRSTE